MLLIGVNSFKPQKAMETTKIKRMYYFIGVCGEFVIRQYRVFGTLCDNYEDAHKHAEQYFNTDSFGKPLSRKRPVSVYFSHTVQ